MKNSPSAANTPTPKKSPATAHTHTRPTPTLAAAALSAALALVTPLNAARADDPKKSAAESTSEKAIAPADDISAPARGTSPTSDTPSEKTAARPATKSSAKNKTLWDHWYTVTVKNLRYEYYNDRAELKDGRLVLQNHAWKREEDYINEEQLAVFAKDDEELTPLFFNFHSTYRSTELTIDGTVNENGGARQLVVKVRKGTNELPVIKKMLPKKTFFATLFPFWLARKLPTFKNGQLSSFQTVLEDNVEADFITVYGQVRVEAPDAYATKTGSTLLDINYRDMKSRWWVDKDGAALRIEMPQQKTVVERVSADTAKKFLGN